MLALLPEHLTALIDSREQDPYSLHPLAAKRASLPTGDYSVEGLADLVAIERKSAPDFLAVVGRERERFERELDRLRAYPYRLVLIESDWQTLERGDYRSRIAPAAVCGTVCAWMGRYQVPFLFAGDRESAERAAVRFLLCAARHELRRLSALQGAIRPPQDPAA